MPTSSQTSERWDVQLDLDRVARGVVREIAAFARAAADAEETGDPRRARVYSELVRSRSEDLVLLHGALRHSPSSARRHG